jgi:acetyltransferase
LDRLFNPRSVAVVGASSQPEKAGNVILRQLIGGTFRIYPVNPNRHDLLGLLCYPSVSSLPERVDVAILSVTAAVTLKAVEECVMAKVPFVISVAGGFSEMGEEGRQIQRKIAEAVKGSETRILGPNTMGSLSLDAVRHLLPSTRKEPRPRTARSLSFSERVSARRIVRDG